MKKIIVYTFLIIFISSCKKQYNCRCVTTVNYPSGSQGFYNAKNSKMTSKMTEKQAKSVCDQEAVSINSTHTNYITNNGNWSSNYNVITKCSLE